MTERLYELIVEAVPAAPVEVPPELAGMDWQTLINKQYEGGCCGKL